MPHFDGTDGKKNSQRKHLFSRQLPNDAMEECTMSRYTVSLRGGFSDRNKIKSENTTIQTTELDERTRVALVTATDIVITHGILFCDYCGSDFEQDFLKHVMADVYGHCVYWENHYTRKTVLPIIYDTIKTDTYDAVLTVIEFVAREISNGCPSGFVFENKRYTSFGFFNRILEREYVGYRFVGGYITPITDPVTSSIEIALLLENLLQDSRSTKYPTQCSYGGNRSRIRQIKMASLFHIEREALIYTRYSY